LLDLVKQPLGPQRPDVDDLHMFGLATAPGHQQGGKSLARHQVQDGERVADSPRERGEVMRPHLTRPLPNPLGPRPCRAGGVACRCGGQDQIFGLQRR
jgi:hypothetical protein